MYVDLPEPKCSQCGSTHSETFQQGRVQGRRCLQCGHEQRISDRDDGRESSIVYSNDTRRTF